MFSPESIHISSSKSPSQVQTPSPTNSKNGDGNPTTPMTIVPIICNPSSIIAHLSNHIDTRKLVDVFRRGATRKPVASRSKDLMNGM